MFNVLFLASKVLFVEIVIWLFLSVEMMNNTLQQNIKVSLQTHKQ